MSFFDQPYYALTKANMSRVGIWPEQTKYVRIIKLSTAFIILMTLAVPTMIRLRDTWQNMNNLSHDLPQFILGTGVLFVVLRYILNFDKIKLAFEHVEGHWKSFKNTSAVMVLDNYGERGRYFIVIYTMLLYIALTLYLVSFLAPTILDFVDPLNETRPKLFIITNVEYGIDVDTYYWFIFAHQCVVTISVTLVIIAMETMYFLLAVHACALFESVGFHLKMVTRKFSENDENVVTSRNDCNYKNMCDCITAHEMAISFADLLESFCSGIFGIVLIVSVIIIALSGVQILIHLNDPHMMMQLVIYIVTQVFHLYINSIPGQELINHSQKIHTHVYDFDWENMSVKAQKLLIPILIRSSKPCQFTARNVYVLSMENFGTTLRTAISYFMVFAQLI